MYSISSSMCATEGFLFPFYRITPGLSEAMQGNTLMHRHTPASEAVSSAG